MRKSKLSSLNEGNIFYEKKENEKQKNNNIGAH